MVNALYLDGMKFLMIFLLALPFAGAGQQLDKMPADLETQLALSALPADLQAGATVYLLDPAKGYYVGRQGTNGFVCFIDRTDWEWAQFRNDVYAPISFDPAGAATTFVVIRDVAAMRASGKFTAQQVRDTVIARIRSGRYTAPARAGISYMLAPVMRVYIGNPDNDTVMTMSMPHYMFYAPYITDADAGTNHDSGPFLNNPDNMILGDRKGPFGYFIVAADARLTAKILDGNKDLLRRLQAYSHYFMPDMDMSH